MTTSTSGSLEWEVSDLLKGKGFSRIAIEANTLLVVYNDVWIRSQLTVDDWGKTIEDLKKISRDLIPDKISRQALLSFMSKNWMDVVEVRRVQENQPRRWRTSEDVVDEHDEAATNANTEDGHNGENVKVEGNPIDYVISVIKQEVKGEDHNIRIILYVGLSSYTFNPLCLAIRAPTSEGKTHMVVKSIGYLPSKDIVYIGSMTPKVLIRQYGTLVDHNNRPIAEEVRELKKEIALAERAAKKDPEKIKLALELKDELDLMLSTSKYLINLHGKILVFLDAPHPGVWNIIKPILSHDMWQVEHPYVDTDIKTKNVVTQGWPVCIFCTARDESRWEIWPEIQSRFLMISPNMSVEKYEQANVLTVQKGGMPDYVQQQVIVSKDEVKMARTCMEHLSREIKRLCAVTDSQEGGSLEGILKPKNPVCIPYWEYLGPSLPHHKGIEMRDATHIMSLLHVIAITKSPFRLDTSAGQPVPGTDIRGSMDVIARPDDLAEALTLLKDVIMSEHAGIPTQKKWFLENVFYPLFDSKTDFDEKNGKTEKIISVTTTELAEEYRRKKGEPVTTDNLKKHFLDELIAANLIGETESEIDGRRHIFYALIDKDLRGDDPRITKLSKNDLFDNISHTSTLDLSKDYKFIPEDWLIFQILSLAKYRIDFGQSGPFFSDFLNNCDEFKLLERVDKYSSQSDLIRLTIRGFISRYENPNSISIRYILRPHFHDSYNRIIFSMREICLLDPKG